MIDPSNQFIYEANFNDSTVTGQSIDQNAGVLDPFSQTTHAPASYTLTGPATWCLVDGRTSYSGSSPVTAIVEPLQPEAPISNAFKRGRPAPLQPLERPETSRT